MKSFNYNSLDNGSKSVESEQCEDEFTALAIPVEVGSTSLESLDVDGSHHWKTYTYHYNSMDYSNSLQYQRSSGALRVIRRHGKILAITFLVCIISLFSFFLYDQSDDVFLEYVTNKLTNTNFRLESILSNDLIKAYFRH